MKRYDSVEPSGPVMGKASQYWTLWIVEEPFEQNSWYGSQMMQYFNYQQNLSMEKDSALEKMKERFGDDFRIDETLNSGRSYSNAVGSIKYKDDIYLFGRYKGQKFDVVNDHNYEKWYYGQVSGTEKDSEVLKKRLSNELVEFDGEFIWLDDLEDKVMKLYEENFHVRGHIGKEGQEYTNWVRLRGVRYINTSFGGMTVYELVDKDGNLIFYKGSKDLDVEKGERIKLKGKIKHEEYYSHYHGKTVQETSVKYPKILQKAD